MRDSSTNLHSIPFLDTKISRDKGVLYAILSAIENLETQSQQITHRL